VQSHPQNMALDLLLLGREASCGDCFFVPRHWLLL
jgi:hypothetical protein